MSLEGKFKIMKSRNDMVKVLTEIKNRSKSKPSLKTDLRFARPKIRGLTDPSTREF